MDRTYGAWGMPANVLVRLGKVREHATQFGLRCISRESNPGHIDGNDVFYH